MKKNLLTAATLLVAGPSAAAKAHKFASAIEKAVKQSKQDPIRVPSTREKIYVIHTL